MVFNGNHAMVYVPLALVCKGACVRARVRACVCPCAYACACAYVILLSLIRSIRNSPLWVAVIVITGL